MESSPRSLLKLEEQSCSTDGNYKTVSLRFSLAPPSWCHWCPQWPTQVPNEFWRVRQPQAPLISSAISSAVQGPEFVGPLPTLPSFFLGLPLLPPNLTLQPAWLKAWAQCLQPLPSRYWLGSWPSLLQVKKVWPQLSLLFQLLWTPVWAQSKPWSTVLWVWGYSPWPCLCHGELSPGMPSPTLLVNISSSVYVTRG